MTGSGSQADPYIVDTWQEFKSVANKSSVYINILTPNQIWDMNELQPSGFSNPIIARSTHINGNNVTLRNVWIRGNYLIAVYGTNYLDNFNIENFYIENGNMFGGGNYANDSYIRGCRFSGILTNSSAFNNAADLVHYTTYGNKGCSFNVELLGSSRWITNYSEYHSYSNMKLVVKSFVAFSYRGPSSFTNSNLIGTFYGPVNISGCSNSVINADVYSTLNTSGNVIVNKDKFHEGYSFVDNTSAHLVTDEQLRDANYLQSIGFPIGV